MKRIFTAVIFLMAFSTVPVTVSAQQSDSFMKGNEGGIQIPDHTIFLSNEIIVKFRDDFTVTADLLEKGASSSKGINTFFELNKIEKAEKLFKSAKPVKSKSIIRTPQGEEMEVPDMHNIYKLVLSESGGTKSGSSDILDIIKDLNQYPEVEYAEPNYLYSIGDFNPSSPVIHVEASTSHPDKKSGSDTKGLTPDDPLFSDQWGIPAINADEVWSTHTGDTNTVIAILDTGVDWLHPDLMDNIWANQFEIPDNGKDDDNNGYVDDIRGWDFISNENNPADDNSHGTHCAGIAAAEGNNGIGIAGVNWEAKIMPIKVFQSSGWADAVTISQGINYAAANGADVISMSFGSYARSLTMEAALANAYSTSVLVAAAGNNGLCIGPGKCPDFREGSPMFPGAISYVLGVQAPPLPPNGFTNYDQDGPVFSGYEEQYNYELSAPGTGILSCIPGGNYRSYNGTSMAAPFAAGAISLYKELYPTQSQELLWGTIINSAGEYLDIFQAINTDPIPVLNVTKFTLSDTLTGGDNDWKADAGEIVQLEVFVRNTWGIADSVFVGVEFNEFEDTTTAVIKKGTGFVGSLGAYATLSNFNDLLEIELSPDIAHGREIRFRLLTWRGMARDNMTTVPVSIRVEHGTELIGVIDDTLRLTADKFWLVSNSFKIGYNGVLILEPGANLKIEEPISNLGQILSNGTKDSMVKIFGPQTIAGGTKKFIFTEFTEFKFRISTDGYNQYTNCKFHDCTYNLFASGSHIFLDCEFYDIANIIFNWSTSFTGEYLNFYNIDSPLFCDWYGPSEPMKHCNFSNFNLHLEDSDVLYSNILSGIINNYSVPPGVYYELPLNYWGTTDSARISIKILDFWDDSYYSLIKYTDILTKPDSLAHGCVWKIEVNNFDAQDEFDQLDPLGVGRHKFEVYFNRPMDVAYPPTVSMGVREPYTQIAINEDASWSPDSLIFTVYKTLGLTDADGINRIRVVGGKDTDGFDLVPEDERFNVNIQSQGSLSTEFMATPGMGKVDLEWGSPEEHVSDLLGYNMYRYTFINDSTTTDTLLISQSMITDTLYTDYEVVPGNRYFYTYKTVRTDFSESSFSNIVAATPYTAAKGDANGDLSVNVSDIVATVSYILLNNPQPFIFEAADVNSDGVINVLDVTGIVNTILNPGKSGYSASANGTASLYIRNDTLFIKSDVPVGGMQFFMHNTTVNDYSVLKTLEGFERVVLQKADSVFFLAYSMTGKTIGPGEVPSIKFSSKSVLIDGLILSDSKGASINSVITDIVNPGAGMMNPESFFELEQNYPNPFTGETTIIFRLIKPVDEVLFAIYDTRGQLVDEILIRHPVQGENRFTWKPKTGSGLYLGKMSVRLSSVKSTEKTIKIIVR